jgi:hypothetical protein
VALIDQLGSFPPVAECGCSGGSVLSMNKAGLAGNHRESQR